MFFVKVVIDLFKDNEYKMHNNKPTALYYFYKECIDCVLKFGQVLKYQNRSHYVNFKGYVKLNVKYEEEEDINRD